MPDPYIPSESCHVRVIGVILEAPGKGLISIDNAIKLSGRGLIGFKVFEIINVKIA